MSNYLWKENLFLPKVEKWPPAQDLKQLPFFNNTHHSTSELFLQFFLFELPDSLMLLMFSGEFGRAFFRALPKTQLLVELS